MPLPLIKLVNITKTYHTGEVEQPILNGIDLDIMAGEQIAIMGASGSGKSTLMHIIGLLDVPTSGHYFLNNKEIVDLNEDERATVRNQTIGFVFQSFFLLPRLTILENVGLPLYYRHWDPDKMDERALDMLKKMGLEKLAHRKPNQLSGGQQQRVAIARALIGNPTFILADEPTGALDSKTGKMIMDLFIELNLKEQVTVVIVTHDPHIAEQCQRVAHITDGKLVGENNT
jgi:putative ABC transport system ATP-binding protein